MSKLNAVIPAQSQAAHLPAAPSVPVPLLAYLGSLAVAHAGQHDALLSPVMCPHLCPRDIHGAWQCYATPKMPQRVLRPAEGFIAMFHLTYPNI